MLLLGIDAGQTVTKAALFDPAGHLLASAAGPTVVTTPAPRHQERDMAHLWRQTATAIRDCLAAAGATGRDVAAIGLTGHNDGVYPVDSHHRPVRPAILATDSRAHHIVDRYHRDGTAEAALTLTGQSPFPGSPAALYRWLAEHEPDTLGTARWLLFCKDWLRLRLTGEPATDPTEASASFTDVHTQRYAESALALYHLPGVASQLPPIQPPHQIAGTVTASAAADTGLAAGTPVVTGAHDVDAAALGTGAVADNAVSVIMGTFAINQVVAAEPRLDHRWQARTFLTPGRWLHMSTSPASASNLDWLTALTGPGHASGPDIPAAIAEAAAVTDPDRPLYLPFLYGSPHGAGLGGAFVGLRGWHRRPELLRAVLDGVACNHRTHLDALRTAFPLTGPVRLSGGAARSPAWCALLADTIDLPVEVTDTDEAGARGAALLAGIGIGHYASLADAADAAVRVTRRHDPHHSAEAADRYHRYRAAVAALADLNAGDAPH